jgi:hypothetical protein
MIQQWKEYECQRCYNVVIKSMASKPMCQLCGRTNGYYSRMVVRSWVM